MLFQCSLYPFLHELLLLNDLVYFCSFNLLQYIFQAQIISGSMKIFQSFKQDLKRHLGFLYGCNDGSIHGLHAAIAGYRRKNRLHRTMLGTIIEK